MCDHRAGVKLRLGLMFFLVFLLAGCAWLRSTATPPPGWRSPVSELLVDSSAFPEEWHLLSEADTDPTVNHVARRWGHMSGAKGEQAIWRAYTVGDAERKYNELRQSQFQPREPLYPGTIFVKFEPPAEIDFHSQIADEFYLACGWWGWAYCQVVARYRNYVVYMSLDQQADHEGTHTDGLSYAEIEVIVRAIDTKFVESLDSLPTPPP